MSFFIKISKLFGTLIIVLCLNMFVQAQELRQIALSQITTAAMQTDKYFPLITNKSIGLVANQSSLIENTHLVDSLLSSGFNLRKVFSPEHGFRGDQDAGKQIKSQKDEKTGLEIVSLYGKTKKPEAASLKDIDIIIFDLQDVGVRFYTYISTLSYVMEACAEQGVPIIVLDRPNPNGYFIDGPVLEKEFQSFVGLHPVPVAYGLTIGEYALMVKGEKWINNADALDLTVIPLEDYSRSMLVELDTPPSPNLPNAASIYLYPSLCFFEGTTLSIGRGTDFPFQLYGHPDLQDDTFTFTPRPIPGASMNPPHNGKLCKGKDLGDFANEYASNERKIHLSWLIEAYSELGNKSAFFTNYFNTLAGNSKLRKQIEAGINEQEIRASWVDDINNYKKIRKNYLLYPDSEFLFDD